MDMTFKLQVFEGPLDLLLYLIEKNKVNIYDIPIVEITAQYMEYVNQMKKDNLDTLSEFLVMAATLLDIKSKMLLPKKEEEEQEQEDPRAELVQQLLEYKMYKCMANELKDRQLDAGKVWYKKKDIPDEVLAYEEPVNLEELVGDIRLSDLNRIFQSIMKRQEEKIDKKGHAMYGYLFYPKNAKQGSHPVVLTPPGAGIKTIKEPMRNKYYAENGFIRLEIEIHGLDPRIPTETFNEISRGFNDANGGYLSNGLEDKNRYYMRHVYQGLVRCIDFLTSLPEWDGKNVAVQGGSQGGALAIIAAGLDKRVTQCVANHPALSDMAAYAEKGRTGGYPHFTKYHEILKNKDCLNTMAYYDVVNFARKVTAPTYLTWGYNDITCPPTTSYAVWNTLKCEKEALLTPINEHWTTSETNYQQMVWIKDHLIR